MIDKNFFQELKRRNVYKVTIAYGITAWLLAQVASLAATTFEAPGWVMKMMLIGLIIGFPVALILAWAFELTPKGMVRTSALRPETLEKGASKGKKSMLNTWLIGILGILVVGILISRQFKASQNTEAGNSTTQELSIAVLPLINLNIEDKDLQYFSDGVTQELIDELAKVKAFSLTAFTTTLLYKNNQKPYDEIGEELDVNFIVSGTSRIISQESGERVILSIELIDSKTKRRLWNNRYEEVLENAPKIQLDVAKDIAGNLKVNLSAEEKEKLQNVNTNSGEAFQYFLKAKHKMSGMTIEGFDQAEQDLLKAIERDSVYTQAYTLLAWNYVLQGWSWYWRDDLSIDEGRQRAKKYIDKAMALDSNSSDIYLVKANFDHTFNANLGDAIKDVEKALELNSWPEIPTNYCICTAVTTYVIAGDLERAKTLASLAGKVDPGNLFIFHDQGIIYMQEGKMLEARAMFQKALDIMDIPIFNFMVGWSLYHSGEFEEAATFFKKSRLNDQLDVGLHLAYLSNIYFKLGRNAESMKYRKQLEDRIEKGDRSLNMAMAIISAEQESEEMTFSFFENAYANKEPMMTYLFSLDPLFTPLKSHDRYQDIWKEVMPSTSNSR